MKQRFKKSIDKMYQNREDFLVIGLTGRTGAGCSTTADILSCKFDELDMEFDKVEDSESTDKLKFDIVREYLKADKHWVPFEVIEGSSVILSFLFEEKALGEHPSDRLVEYIHDLQKKAGRGESAVEFRIEKQEELENAIHGLDYIYERVSELPLADLEAKLGNAEEKRKFIQKYYQLYIVDMPRYKEDFKRVFEGHHCSEIKRERLQTERPMQHHLYTYLLQKFGNNIRSSGNPYKSKFKEEKIFAFAKRLDLLIRLIKVKKGGEPTRICIDAIRNANESNYIKNQYRNYYLISISVDEEERLRRLRRLTAEEIDSIDNIEYRGDYKAKAFFYQQNISQCFEMSDIHIYNGKTDTERNFFLIQQLMRYVALMIHPGLVTPTHVERCMQLAFNAKYNSGCLSRQVGAVVTGEDFSIKSVGWNDVPKGHITCNLRDLRLCVNEMAQESFSQYEMTDGNFRKAARDIHEELSNYLESHDLGGRRFPYCFKDVYNGYTCERNQVYTRSLHAEENAFLQISKYGGQGIQGGKLFVTASPCELCSKKSYQLGIKDIYYIDRYPGISEKHIINVGSELNRPKMHLFYGAIGEAYISLYRPIMPYKDELELISGCNPRNIAKMGGRSTWREPDVGDFKYKLVEFVLTFKSREEIICIRKIKGKVKHGTHEYIDKNFVWTGSSYDGSELIKGKDCELEMINNKPGDPIHYRIRFGSPKEKGDRISYTIKSNLKDVTKVMRPYISNVVACPTKRLILKVEDKADIINEMQYVRYADKEMKIVSQDHQNKVKESKNGTFTLIIDNPNLFYTYALEWKFQ